MTKEMYVSSTPHETKVALVEDDQVAEIFFERENEYTLAGSIYKGRVTRVLPGMQSAFVDIGLERDAFLYVSDFLELPEDEESEFEDIAVTRPEAFVSNRPAPEPDRFELKPQVSAAESEEAEEEAEDDLTEGNTQEFAEAEAGEEEPSSESAERFRSSRRRRRGRRGRGFPESKFARPDREEQAEENEPQVSESFDEATAYEPVVLPGESLSKYRGRDAAEVPASSDSLPTNPESDAAEPEITSESGSEMESAPQQSPAPRTEVSASAAEPVASANLRMVLPGESLAKYQPRDTTSGSRPSEESDRSQRNDRERPARESSRYERRDHDSYRDTGGRGYDSRPANVDRRSGGERDSRSYTPRGGGFAVLPGESIAKYRQAPPTAEKEVVPQEQAQSAAEQEESSPRQAATFVIESEPWIETLAHQADREAAQGAEEAHTAAMEPESNVAPPLPAVTASSELDTSAAPPAESTFAQTRGPEISGFRLTGAESAVRSDEPMPSTTEKSSAGQARPGAELAQAPVTSVEDSCDAAKPSEPPTPGPERAEEVANGESINPAAVFDGNAAEHPAELPEAEPSAAQQTGHLGTAVESDIVQPPLQTSVAEAVEPVQVAESGSVQDLQRFGRPGAGTLEHEEIEGDEEEGSYHAPVTEDEPDADEIELLEETLEAGDPRRLAVEAATDVPPSQMPSRLDEVRDAVEMDGEAVDSRFAPDDVAEAEEEAEGDEEEGDFEEDTEFEEEELVEGEEALPEEQQEEAIGRAELHGPAATAGYQHAPERVPFDRRNRGRRGGRGRVVRRREYPRQQVQISDLLKEGQEVLVQIAKEPIGKKGARITSHIALPGRFLVYMPTVNHIGVSRKITSDEERQRLKRIMLSEREGGHGGFIVRTAAAGIGEDELRADIRFLKSLWSQIKQRSENSKPPALIYHDLNLVERILRDQVTSDFSQIWVDTEQEYERILNFANRFQPSLVRRVKLYTKETPLFEQFGLHEEINKALKAKVWLKSGGYIVINQTEALVAIDINTGKYVGKTARLEDTIVKTNIDAIKEIVRQIRLRDLGGIIVIDFIDMDERKNRQKVMQALEEALKSDRSPSKVLAFNDFGLVAITRKRVKQSLERTLGSPCPYCSGNGLVKSVTTVCNDIYVEMRKMARHLDRTDTLTLRVNPEVAKALKAEKGKWLADFEEVTSSTVLVKPDPLLHQEQFDIHQ